MISLWTYNKQHKISQTRIHLAKRKIHKDIDPIKINVHNFLSLLDQIQNDSKRKEMDSNFNFTVSSLRQKLIVGPVTIPYFTDASSAWEEAVVRSARSHGSQRPRDSIPRRTRRETSCVPVSAARQIVHEWRYPPSSRTGIGTHVIFSRVSARFQRTVGCRLSVVRIWILCLGDWLLGNCRSR